MIERGRGRGIGKVTGRGRGRGRGSGRGKRRREDDDSPIPPRIDVANSYQSWPKLADGRTHIVNFILDKRQLDTKFRFNGGKGGVCTAYRLLSTSARLKRIIDSTNWNYVCQVNELRHDNKLVFTLMERWCPTTHSFHLPQAEVGLTPYDFTAITGVTVGIGDIVPFQKWGRDVDVSKREKLVLFSDLFPKEAANFRGWIDKEFRGISCRKLGKVLQRAQVPAHDDMEDDLSNHEVYLLRCFFLYVMGIVWFPNSKRHTPFGLLETVRNVTEIGRYDWGAAIMANIYYNLDRCVSMKLGQVQCYWEVFQYWYWEVFGIPAPLLIDPNLDVYPRILRWAPERQRRGVSVSGIVEHVTVPYRLRLEEASYFTICRNAYSSSLLYQTHTLRQIWNFSHTRTILGGAGQFVWYLGERLFPCLSSSMDSFGIPYPPPTQMQVKKSKYTNWLTKRYLPIPGSNVRWSCTNIVWIKYWSVVSGKPRLTLRFRIQNNEYVSLLAGHHWGEMAAEFPGPSASTGPVETSQRPADLTTFVTPDTIQIPEGVSITLQPHEVELPLYASSESWRQWGLHEQGLLRATRDFVVELSKQNETSRRRLQRYIDVYGDDIDFMADSSSYSNDDQSDVDQSDDKEDIDSDH